MNQPELSKDMLALLRDAEKDVLQNNTILSDVVSAAKVQQETTYNNMYRNLRKAYALGMQYGIKTTKEEIFPLPRTASSEYVPVLKEIRTEAVRAKRLYPEWPSDPVVSTAIMVEEAGEAMKAALDMKFKQKTGKATDSELYSRLREEAIQTAAMCLRILMETPKPWKTK